MFSKEIRNFPNPHSGDGLSIPPALPLTVSWSKRRVCCQEEQNRFGQAWNQAARIWRQQPRRINLSHYKRETQIHIPRAQLAPVNWDPSEPRAAGLGGFLQPHASLCSVRGVRMPLTGHLWYFHFHLGGDTVFQAFPAQQLLWFKINKTSWILHNGPIMKPQWRDMEAAESNKRKKKRKTKRWHIH